MQFTIITNPVHHLENQKLIQNIQDRIETNKKIDSKFVNLYVSKFPKPQGQHLKISRLALKAILGLPMSSAAFVIYRRARAKHLPNNPELTPIVACAIIEERFSLPYGSLAHYIN